MLDRENNPTSVSRVSAEIECKRPRSEIFVNEMEFSKTVNFSIEWDEMKQFAEEIIDDDVVAEMYLVRSITNLFMLAVFVVGVPLNLMVCVIVLKQQSRSPLSIIVTSLAIADLLVIFKFSVTTLTHELYDGWIFGSATCTFVIFFVCFCQSFEAIMLATAFAAFLLKPKISQRSVWRIVALVLIASFMLAIPKGLNAVAIDYDDRQICAVDFDADNRFVVLSQLIKLLLPWAIFIILIGVFALQSISQTKLVQMKVNRLLLVLFAAFLLVATPFAVVKILIDLRVNIQYSLLSTAQLLALMSLVYKPLVYILMEKEFKREITDSQSFLPI